jgi:N-acetylglucosamine-6-phosphate deacetylase
MNLLNKMLRENQSWANLVKDKMHSKLNTMIIKLTNCRLIRNSQLIQDDLLIRNGKILDPMHVFYVEKRMPDFEVHCNNLIISPGFIDTQLNGGFGRDFTNTDENLVENLKYVSEKLLAYGVTAYCPTIISSHPQVYAKLLPLCARNTTPQCNGAYVLGVHLEGPFISKDKLGCHDIQTLQTLSNGIQSLEAIYGRPISKLKENVSIITLAPELDETGEVIRSLTENGIIVSIGHSTADLAQGERAFANGARYITHLFNAMVSFHHRDPNLIGLLSNRNLVKQEDIYYGVIVDDIHTHPAAVNISYKSHPNGLVLVTDSMAGMGVEEGSIIHIGKQTVEIIAEPSKKRFKRAYLKGTTTLAGAVVTMNDCVLNLMNATGCSIAEAAKCASEHPAKLLGIFPNKGSLNYGADADLVILDENVNIKATFLNGDLAWSLTDWFPLFRCKHIS